jgi:hypothetical protein
MYGKSPIPASSETATSAAISAVAAVATAAVPGSPAAGFLSPGAAADATSDDEFVVLCLRSGCDAALREATWHLWLGVRPALCPDDLQPLLPWCGAVSLGCRPCGCTDHVY